jgi:hypothetical protein
VVLDSLVGIHGGAAISEMLGAAKGMRSVNSDEDCYRDSKTSFSRAMYSSIKLFISESSSPLKPALVTRDCNS